MAKQQNNCQAARIFKVNEKMIRNWRKKEMEIANLAKENQNPDIFTTGGKHIVKQKFRIKGGGMKCRTTNLQKELLAWILQQREKQLPVGHNHIKRKALELAKAIGNHDFRASSGWVNKFVKKNGLSFRAHTHVSQKLPQELIPKVCLLFKYIYLLNTIKYLDIYKDFF